MSNKNNNNKNENETEKPRKKGEVTYELIYPFEFGKTSVTEIVMRRPKAKDIEHMSTSPTFKELMIVASKISANPKPMIDMIDGEDALAIAEVVGDFLDSGRKTGEDVYE